MVVKWHQAWIYAASLSVSSAIRRDLKISLSPSMGTSSEPGCLASSEPICLTSQKKRSQDLSLSTLS
jgi:hypothetical protein